MVFLKEIFQKVDFEKKNQQTSKKHENFPGGKEVRTKSSELVLLYYNDIEVVNFQYDNDINE